MITNIYFIGETKVIIPTEVKYFQLVFNFKEDINWFRAEYGLEQNGESNFTQEETDIVRKSILKYFWHIKDEVIEDLLLQIEPAPDRLLACSNKLLAKGFMFGFYDKIPMNVFSFYNEFLKNNETFAITHICNIIL